MRVILLVMLIYSTSQVAHAASCTLRMAVETNFPPHLIKQDEQWTGLSIQLMELLAAEVGCELQLVNSPWLRSLQLSAQGQLDVISHLSYTAQRQAQFAFIGPHHIESIYMIGDPSQLPEVHQLQQLSEQVDFGSIATLHGAYYGEAFEALRLNEHFASQLVTIRSIQDKLALLRAGRVNVILEDLSVVRYWQQHGYDAAERFQPLLKVYESPVYFGFSKTSLPDTQLQALADAWQQLHQQGKIAEIYHHYNVSMDANLTPAPRL